MKTLKTCKVGTLPPSALFLCECVYSVCLISAARLRVCPPLISWIGRISMWQILVTVYMCYCLVFCAVQYTDLGPRTADSGPAEMRDVQNRNFNFVRHIKTFFNNCCLISAFTHSLVCVCTTLLYTCSSLHIHVCTCAITWLVYNRKSLPFALLIDSCSCTLHMYLYRLCTYSYLWLH